MVKLRAERGKVHIAGSLFLRKEEIIKRGKFDLIVVTWPTVPSQANMPGFAGRGIENKSKEQKRPPIMANCRKL